MPAILPPSSLQAHEGPDPVAHWAFSARSRDGEKLKSRLGPDATLSGEVDFQMDQYGAYAAFPGEKNIISISSQLDDVRDLLPQKLITISAWVAVEKRQQWGGIIGVLQDNGGEESGWILGFNEKSFYFGLASEGSNDGDGLMTYLSGKTLYEPGRYYHVVAVYDGERMHLYVNGKLDAVSEDQSGDILYPKQASWVMAGYRDRNEAHSLKGRLREIRLYDSAAQLKWIEHDFSHNAKLSEVASYVPPPKLDLVVGPYLQHGTQTAMTAMWQTTRSASSTVHYGETADCRQSLSTSEPAFIHEVTLENLEPETQYFYRVESTVEESKEKISSDVWTFTTAVKKETPFAFAVISDTQGNPAVSGKLAAMAWGQRPSFLLHPGDLVDTGTNDRHWTEHFFASMQPLIGRVAFYPVLGNHEQNARNYFDYMSLPDPEYFYDFKYGNAHFFMIDTNRKVDPNSEQYLWLKKKLSESNSRWKFVCHHHPPFSSDENDYGNLWKTNKSTRGDARVRQLVPLYEKYGVDIVWNGHIHSYERTWPLLASRAVERKGVIYMITGGGGGSLETPGPFRPFFQNTVRRGHHYVMVHINGGMLEFKAYDLEGRLFDYMKLEKPEISKKTPSNPTSAK
jgi:acid phosphatase type 7